MSFHFKTHVPLEVLESFENEYEEALQEDADTLRLLHLKGLAVGLYCGREPAAVTIGIPVSKMDDSSTFPDVEPWNYFIFDDKILYVYATTVKKEFQGKGLGKLICAYYAGYARALGFEGLIGHATSDSMRAIRTWMGAEFQAVHEKWCGSERTAVFYVQPV